ncbi:hypothetical protein [Actinoplanes lobatus]|uniref:Uncharacterized protein n=1 Tax=Actinoplanes lobatus TaxID=113568 RepID=A0A7W7HNP7_9ACTN|nr:hypothetical protein [Actinoplanes lobatus]MBB4753880.1 hypothetical protein [Actinoplanes lobatus]
MGGLKPWHVLCLLFCMLSVTAIVAAVLLITRSRATRRPPDA